MPGDETPPIRQLLLTLQIEGVPFKSWQQDRLGQALLRELAAEGDLEAISASQAILCGDADALPEGIQQRLRALAKKLAAEDETRRR